MGIKTALNCGEKNFRVFDGFSDRVIVDCHCRIQHCIFMCQTLFDEITGQTTQLHKHRLDLVQTYRRIE